MKTFSSKSNARRAARKQGLSDDVVTPIEGGRWAVILTDSAQETVSQEPPAGMVQLATEDQDLGLVAKDDAGEQAAKAADELKTTVYVRDTTTDEVLMSVSPAGATMKPKKAKAAKKAAGEGKETMAEQCLALARRPEGVTPAELNELTGWKGAPWKWLFTNPKGTGWCDRRGLAFAATKESRDEGKRPTAVYRVTGEASQQAA